jgi:hypothetical protein
MEIKLRINMSYIFTKTFKNCLVNHILLFCILMISISCHADKQKMDATPEPQPIQSANIENMEANISAIILKNKLTEIPLNCLIFEKQKNELEYAILYDIRELHNNNCPGDQSTSPRLFSVGIDKENGIWSDAKSLLGEMEKL